MKASAIRRGNVILFQGAPHRVMDAHLNTPGNLKGLVQLKLRNLLTGNQTETKFSSTEDVEEPDIHSAKATYMYEDGENYFFMMGESYEQVAVETEVLGDGVYFLQEEMEVSITFYNDSPVGVDLPQTVVLTIMDTEPELKGATASNSPKPAKTDTGLTLSVPPFVKISDKIIVKTADGTYLKRADS
jgi:elongation factor P